MRKFFNDLLCVVVGGIGVLFIYAVPAMMAGLSFVHAIEAAFGICAASIAGMALADIGGAESTKAFFGFGKGDLSNDPRIWRVYIALAAALFMIALAIMPNEPEVRMVMVPFLAAMLAGCAVLFARPQLLANVGASRTFAFAAPS